MELVFAIEMEAEVAMDKSAVVASSKGLAGAIARRGCGLSHRDCAATIALGADVTVGTARRCGASAAARRARMAAVRGRL